MFSVVIIAILVTMAMALARALMGPTIYDRILGRPDFLDIALVYALINFIGTVAILKFFEYHDLGTSAYQEDDY